MNCYQSNQICNIFKVLTNMYQINYREESKYVQTLLMVLRVENLKLINIWVVHKYIFFTKIVFKHVRAARAFLLVWENYKFLIRPCPLPTRVTFHVDFGCLVDLWADALETRVAMSCGSVWQKKSLYYYAPKFTSVVRWSQISARGKSIFYYRTFSICLFSPLNKILSRFTTLDYCAIYPLIRFIFFFLHVQVEF